MITRAVIRTINAGSNTCEIRIPIFEGPGNTNEANFTAVMNIPPGIHSGYVEGDVVFVGFVDNSLSKPVVLGKLYLNNIGNALMQAEKNEGYVCCGHLEVEGKARFSDANSILLGETNLYEAVITKINGLTEKVNTLQAELDLLKSKLNVT